MINADRPTSLAKLLAGYGIFPTKRWGQHFLVDRRHLVKLIQIKELQAVETVLEVGPGPGNLTEMLLDKGFRVLAVEIDDRFVGLLHDRFGQRDDFTLYRMDVLYRGRLNPTVTSALRACRPRPWALVSNLPYQVATTVMLEVLYLPFPPEVICVTIQKEVAARLGGTPGTRDYSALSVLVQSAAAVKRVSPVPAGSFWPAPKVDSAIVKLVPYRPPRVADAGQFRGMVSAIFRNRRKTLRAGFLKSLSPEERERFGRAFDELGIDASFRAQQLAVDDFIGLGNIISTGWQRPEARVAEQ